MAEPLKRLNYFTGQFLEEPDFKAEQTYHRRVLQMLTYATFTPGVLNGLSVNKIDGSRVVVLKGVAIDALENLAEGDQQSRPIVLTGDITLNLRGGPGGLGFSDGDDVFLYVRYQEEPTDGAVPKNTRFLLREEVLTLRDAGAGFTLNTNLNIPLALVQLAGGDLTVVTDAASRRTAGLRLTVGPGPGPGATLVSITVAPLNTTLTVGSSQTYQATGAFNDGNSHPLTSADGLSWSSSDTGVVSINAATGQAQAVSAGGPVTITATVGVILGTATVQVQPAVSPVNIEFLVPTLQGSGGTVDIFGTNLRDPNIAPPNQAAGTSVRVFKAAVSLQVPPADTTVRPNDVGGRQVVRIRVPNRPGAWAVDETVTLELLFGGGSDTIAFQYDD